MTAHVAEMTVASGVGGEHERETAEEDAPVFHGVAAHIGVVRHEPDNGRDSQEPDDGHEDRQGKLEQQSLAYDVPGRLVLALAVPSRDEGDRSRPDDLIGRAQDPGDRPEHRQRGDVTHTQAPDPVDVGQGVDGHRPETDHRGDAHIEHVLEDVALCDVNRGLVRP
jgi:hypothetical protein